MSIPPAIQVYQTRQLILTLGLPVGGLAPHSEGNKNTPSLFVLQKQREEGMSQKPTGQLYSN